MAKPVWLDACFHHAVVGHSLAYDASHLSTALALPSDAFALVGRQLQLLSTWSSLPDSLKEGAARASVAFLGSIELLQPSAEASADPQAASAFLATLIARLRALKTGHAIVLARSDEAAGAGLCLLVVHRCANCDYTVALCASGASALEYHPQRVDGASGGRTEHAMPLLLREVPARVTARTPTLTFSRFTRLL